MVFAEPPGVVPQSRCQTNNSGAPRSGRFGSAAVRISSQDAQQEQVGV